MSSKSKNKQTSLTTSAATAAANSGAVAVLPLASVLETRVPVVLIVGGPGVGKTSVAAAVLHDAVKHGHLRVLALVPNVASFRMALERCGGGPATGSLPVGVDVIQVAEEVSGGCVCCTVRRDIEDVLADEALAGTPSFDLVVIDTASSSDPMPVIATLFEEHANEVNMNI
jgi:G3E family GTPase